MDTTKIISCRIATELMSKSFEKKLTLKEEIQLKTHLSICKTCVLCLKQIRSIRQYLARYAHKHISDPKSSIKMPVRYKQKIQKAIRQSFFS